jgi:hypothetical protein
MPIGSSGVTDYANTTSGDASGVTALYGVGGAGVVESGGTPPVITNYILTENSDPIITESGNNLITET